MTQHGMTHTRRYWTDRQTWTRQTLSRTDRPTSGLAVAAALTQVERRRRRMADTVSFHCRFHEAAESHDGVA